MTPRQNRVRQWIVGHAPTQASIEANRWLRPFAHLLLRSALWRFNRRSVPRAVALGIFLGITLPVAHSVLAALLAVVVGANVPVAFMTTWAISNPLTWFAIYAAAFRIGRFVLHVDGIVGLHPLADAGLATHAGGAAHVAGHAHGHGHMLHSIAQGGAVLACGLFVEATVLAALGYVLTGFGWRLWIGRKRRRRLARMADAPA